MTPQPRGIVPPEHLAAVRAAQTAVDDAHHALKVAVVEALEAGASYAELAKATGIAGTTSQRWVRELGGNPAGRVARQADRDGRADFDARLRAAEAIARAQTDP